MNQIDEYLDSLSPGQKKHLARIRELVHAEVPDCEETFSYGMPTIKYKGKALMHFAAFKNHLSIFPASGKALAKLDKDISKFRTSKGTLQFTEDNPVPEEIIRELVRIRKSEIK